MAPQRSQFPSRILPILRPLLGGGLIGALPPPRERGDWPDADANRRPAAAERARRLARCGCQSTRGEKLSRVSVFTVRAVAEAGAGTGAALLCPRGRGSEAPASGGDRDPREWARAAPGSGGVRGDRRGGAWPGSRGPLRGHCDTAERVVALWGFLNRPVTRAEGRAGRPGREGFLRDIHRLSPPQASRMRMIESMDSAVSRPSEELWAEICSCLPRPEQMDPGDAFTDSFVAPCAPGSGSGGSAPANPKPWAPLSDSEVYLASLGEWRGFHLHIPRGAWWQPWPRVCASGDGAPGSARKDALRLINRASDSFIASVSVETRSVVVASLPVPHKGTFYQVQTK